MPNLIEQIKNYGIYFLIGGTITVLIVALEQSNHRLLSALAAITPVFTVVAYFFIGESKGGAAVANHAWLVILGTLVAWIPYMMVVAYLSPRIGSTKAIPTGLGVFFFLAVIYVEIVNYFRLFR